MKPPLYFLCLIFSLCLSCQSIPKSHLRPQGLQGQQVAFYRVLEPNEMQGGDVLCVFKKDGRYVGLLDGQEFDYGEYAYEFLRGPEQAKVVFVSKLADLEERWVYQLDFATPYSGHWELKERGNLKLRVRQKGDFRYLQIN